MKNPRIFLIVQVFFLVFQAEDFGKLSAPAFRICLDRFRAPETEFQPSSFHFSVFFQLLDLKKYENPTFSFYF